MNLRNCRAYGAGQDLVTDVLGCLAGLPRGWGYLADQARRAATSIPLNIAEGVGRINRGERRHAFDIAIGSAHEVAAAIEILHRAEVVSDQDFDAIWDLCDHVSRMLGAIRKHLG